MKSITTYATLALLFATGSAKESKGKLVTLDADGKQTGDSDTGSAQPGDSFTVEALVTQETAYVQLVLGGNDVECAWSYKTSSKKKPKKVTSAITACDYDIRSVSGKQQTLMLPMSNFPKTKTGHYIVGVCKSTDITSKENYSSVEATCGTFQDATGILKRP